MVGVRAHSELHSDRGKNPPFWTELGVHSESKYIVGQLGLDSESTRSPLGVLGLSSDSARRGGECKLLRIGEL